MSYHERHTITEQLREAEAVMRDQDRRLDEIAFALGCRNPDCEHEEDCIDAAIAKLREYKDLLGREILQREGED